MFPNPIPQSKQRGISQPSRGQPVSVTFKRRRPDKQRERTNYFFKKYLALQRNRETVQQLQLKQHQIIKPERIFNRRQWMKTKSYSLESISKHRITRCRSCNQNHYLSKEQIPLQVFNNSVQYLPSKKTQELYQSIIEQDGLVYKIKIMIDGQLFKIMATTEEQSYTRVLEMMKSDGILLLKNVFQNDYQKLVGSLQISNKITIKGIELIETHGNFG
ncbi:unnamed protein product (macronuclear) [Paramecium tetraurelia]|uniref:Uncharacterized protein n=1 Tax=Paramecium tetraurelia TaxID=5888 RepID=A0DB77_PARTE|nr:uncharacterized protein GSPATT00015188001 [Paramecium tetraurelia]CAK80294.1 unnamed protein product [Paramecium tetraurelia]|eukprot:XP_001447691.1 hypothetical protein (macronuclear) [Paramecium tetraurelia strain d4-2]